MRALDALVGYGVDAFLKVFYEKLGEAYMRPHEAGLRSLFKAIGRDVGPALMDVDQAQKDLQNAFLARRAKEDARP
ncbi:hypothetical protein OSH08_05690 [Kaistia geumhonensis]|uniref:Uncharacterized protein n=1 Tax=Kaistia geumhonensis TaxID=410839 RepID=A0ABU0M5Q3_9HYPH|nr:hypothetical protein [Kaistia geumhonensis]MCX5478486.1 hypothetical protein [Kaistia geumhonensis]MDQ0516296.1 hypothetical protein [Kaistia geumhonensis]